ncbi:MAG: glycosyltransferase family protein [Acidiferrobacterales bacterium]
MRARRVMCYVQHLMGTGHQWRAAAISRAMCQLGMDVTYVSGGFPVPGLDVDCTRSVQLPPTRSADMRYKTLVDERGLPVDDDWKAVRRSTLLETFLECQPDVLLIETFPFGRRLLRFELLPLLDTAHALRPRPHVVCSVRDILENRPKPGHNEKIVDLVHTYFDLVLVHSDPEFVPFQASFPLTDCIARKLCYTGFVMRPRGDSKPAVAGTGEVIVSAGGGVVGEHLLHTAMKARPLSSLAQVPWRILVGHHFPATRLARLRAGVADGVIIEQNRPDFATLLRHCAVSISQGGYNTLFEVLDAGARAVVVPYSDEQQEEQAVRARLLAERGLIVLVDKHALTPSRLAQAVDIASNRPHPKRPAINMNGASTTAHLIATVMVQNHSAASL